MAANLIQAALLFRSGPEKDFPVPEGPEIGLGQENDNGVRVPFPGVSRHHAKITYDGKGYWIEDVGSANGTFVNGRRVGKKERLEHLDVLSLGRRTDLIFVRRKMEAARVTRRGIKNAWLEIMDGLEADTRKEIPRGAITIGRSTSNNVVADSQLVSKIHVRLEQSGVQLLLIDLQSSNGTFINGERIESIALSDGDEFTLGGVRSYRVHIEWGNVETSEVPRTAKSVSSIVHSLPIDWKTRIEWSPQEKAALEQLQGARAKASATAPRPSVAVPKEPAKASPPVVKAEPVAPPAPPAAIPEKAKAPEPAAPVAPQAVSPPAAAREAAKPAAPVKPPPPAVVRAAAAPAVPPAAAAPADAALMEETRAVPSVPVVRVTLQGAKESFPLAAGDHVVGRVVGVSIRLDTPQISRRHAVLRVSKTGTVVEDLASSNGTFVNKEKIAAPRTLAEGDTVQFGDIPFVVRFGQGSRTGQKT